MTERQLKESLSENRLSRAYLLYGDEQYQLRRFVDLIIKKSVTANETFNLAKFDGDADLQTVYDAAEALPFMSEKKCVCLCDFPFEKAKEADLDRLIKIIEALGDTTVFILWFETIAINEKKPGERFKKLQKAVSGVGGNVVCFPRRKKDELAHMLCAGAARRNCRMHPSTANYLIDVSTNDIETLANELEKLCAYAKDGVITRQTIDEVVSRSVEASVYNISRSLLSKNLGAAMKTLDDLLYMQTEPIVILSVLGEAYIDIYRAMAASKAGVGIGDAAEELGYAHLAFRMERAETYARRMSPAAIKACLCAILSADRDLKTSKVNKRVVLEKLLLELIRCAEE